MNDTGATPPGWYADSTGTMRWWDGRQWTDHAAPPPPAVAASQSSASGSQPAFGWFQPWVVVVSLIVFLPLGLFLMWKGGLWSSKARWAVTAGVAVLAVIALASGGGEPTPTTTVAAPSQPVVSPTAAPVDSAAAAAALASQAAASYSAEAAAVEASAEAAASEAAASQAAASEAAAAQAAAEEAYAEASRKAAAEAAKPRLTVSQENAIESANSYLSFSAFSKKGLIKQLKFEGFSTADATYAVNHVEVDWNEQAAKSAKSYLEFTSFSRSGLIRQLKFEGFTTSQAEYGARSVGF